jgi:hypothetical protein
LDSQQGGIYKRYKLYDKKNSVHKRASVYTRPKTECVDGTEHAAAHRVMSNEQKCSKSAVHQFDTKKRREQKLQEEGLNIELTFILLKSENNLNPNKPCSYQKQLFK